MNPKTKTPIIPAVIIGVLAILILVVNIRQPQIFVVVTSIGIIMIYIAYLLVTGPMLLARLRGPVAAEGRTGGLLLASGGWGLPINVIAVVWGAVIASTWPGRGRRSTTPPSPSTGT